MKMTTRTSRTRMPWKNEATSISISISTHALRTTWQARDGRQEMLEGLERPMSDGQPARDTRLAYQSNRRMHPLLESIFRLCKTKVHEHGARVRQTLSSPTSTASHSKRKGSTS
ncbi:hypothetical protein CERZMDRAFT_107731, partial [Cercospora zeae-maydis SCOH1-5]